MANATIPDPIIRTTSDGDGFTHGLVTGTGPAPDAALAGLEREARRLVEGMAGQLPADAEAGRWGVEVIDVRLTPGPADAGQPGWLAYGTLRTTGLSPMAADPWRDR